MINLSTALQGDATKETPNWRGASTAYFVITASPVFMRYIGFFGYVGCSGSPRSDSSSRAVVVCGSGLLYDG